MNYLLEPQLVVLLTTGLFVSDILAQEDNWGERKEPASILHLPEVALKQNNSSISITSPH